LKSTIIIIKNHLTFFVFPIIFFATIFTKLFCDFSSIGFSVFCWFFCLNVDFTYKTDKIELYSHKKDDEFIVLVLLLLYK
jgi:hypothetical protein